MLVAHDLVQLLVVLDEANPVAVNVDLLLLQVPLELADNVLFSNAAPSLNAFHELHVEDGHVGTIVLKMGVAEAQVPQITERIFVLVVVVNVGLSVLHNGVKH